MSRWASGLTTRFHAAGVAEPCRRFFKARERQTSADLARIHACIDPAVERLKALDEEKQEEFRSLLTSFRNLYSFLLQVIPY